MRRMIDTLGIVEHHLQGISGRLYFVPPTDFLRNLPALIVEQAPPQVFSENLPNAYHGAAATVTLNAIAGSRGEAEALCLEAAQRLEDAVNVVTPKGWITRCTVSQLPHLAQHRYERATVFQYSAAVQLVFRQDPAAND
ncbi:hypothetical protein [Rothia aeria]|uniref:hypothetical protein n=1 Tax=Rothia aeria TaxID=172042 RepID=UPI003C7DCD64